MDFKFICVLFIGLMNNSTENFTKKYIHDFVLMVFKHRVHNDDARMGNFARYFQDGLKVAKKTVETHKQKKNK